MKSRQSSSRDVRVAAADLAFARSHPIHHSNGDEGRLRRRDKGGVTNSPSLVGNFTKGMPHDENGFIKDPKDYADWVKAIDSGAEADIAAVRIGPGPHEPNGHVCRDADGQPIYDWAHTYPAGHEPKGLRAWESQGAGLTYDLEGPDSHAVTMPPAPSLGSQELVAEMAEVYWMALCRDVPFANWPKDPQIKKARASLAQLAWFRRDGDLRLGATDRLATSLNRRRILIPADDSDPTRISFAQLFRGVGPGETVGPYVSQFLLVGSEGKRDNVRALQLDSLVPHERTEGYIADGALRIDQPVRIATKHDFMRTWEEWLDVQNGANVGGNAKFQKPGKAEDGSEIPTYRFISRPRDLATFVHFDALYEAYLNACLILLSMKTPRDPGLPFLGPDEVDKQQGFAQFGDPHILTLVTEVATRALKAVRYQKFNVHRRLRPEAVAGWLERLDKGPYAPAGGKPSLDSMELTARLAPLSTMLGLFQSSLVGLESELGSNWLLPMAFPEGSPVHPSYGAGHATVAGACVTLLKAWFDHGWELRDTAGNPIAFQADAEGACLTDVSASLKGEALTVEGELNKLAANISIGRNWAGVHYYSDYIESYRLGEQVAIGLLEEQKLTYGENFSLTVPLLDGTTRRI